MGTAGAGKEGAEGGSRRSMVCAEVAEAAGEGTSGTGAVVATGALGDDLAAFTILLVDKGEGGAGGPKEVTEGASASVELAVANGEGHVLEGKWCVFPGFAVFSWAEEEEDRDPSHVDEGCCPGIIQIGGPVSMMKDLHR
jgi:hypothetical protein